MTAPPDGEKPISKREAARRVRLAAELKANIAKRKAQARARAEQDKADTGEPGADPGNTDEPGSR